MDLREFLSEEQNHCRVSSLASFFLDNWMWKFLMAQPALLDNNRGPKKGPPRGPFMNNQEVSNDVLVETALSWLAGLMVPANLRRNIWCVHTNWFLDHTWRLHNS